MHRLAVPAASDHSWNHLIPTPPASGLGGTLGEGRLSRPHDTPTTTFLPLSYEPGYAYPLLIWLHESDANERHLPQVMQHLSTQNFVAVAPRAPQASQSTERGYRWTQQPMAISEATDAVEEAIELARDKFNVHTDRVFLLGHGQGGTMALRLAMQSPQQFAGVASINGKVPRGHGLLRNINHLRQLPFFVASARQGRSYPERQVCRDLRLLHSAGCNVSLRQYPGDDDLTTCMLADVNRWVMGRVCGG